MFLVIDVEEYGLLGVKVFVNIGVFESYCLFVNLNLDMLLQFGGCYDLLVSGVKSYLVFEDFISQIEMVIFLFMINIDVGYCVGCYFVKGDCIKVSDYVVFVEWGILFLFFGVGRYNYYYMFRDMVFRINEGFYGWVVDVFW